jgi:hypothetical protein
MIGSIAALRWNRFLALLFSLGFLDPFPAPCVREVVASSEIHLRGSEG